MICEVKWLCTFSQLYYHTSIKDARKQKAFFSWSTIGHCVQREKAPWSYLESNITMRNYCNNIHLPILILRPCESFYLLCYEVTYSENICKITGNGGNFFWNVILLVIPLPFHFNTFHSSRCIAIKAVPRLALHFISYVWWIRHIQHIQRAIYFIMKDIYSYLPLLRI